MPRNQKTAQYTPLATLPLVGPGFRGLNTELSLSEGVQSSDWASLLDNVVWDDLGRITLRKGYTFQNDPASNIGATFEVHHMHEYLQEDGTVSLVCVTFDPDNPGGDAYKIWRSSDEGITWVDITGDLDLLFSNLDLQFANFNGDLYIGVSGHRIHRYNETLTEFKDIADSPISNGSLIGAFGRLWAGTDANSQIGYSGLLDGTDWVSLASGTIDASNAWTDGQDTVEAIASFGATLVIFGQRHILMYVDGAGSELGVDPDNLYVVDTIEGTGTLNRDSVINIGEGDMWFLGPQGIQSLSRVIEEKVNPLTNISVDQRSLVTDFIIANAGNPSSVKAIYNHVERFVIYSFPNQNRVLAYDLRFPIGPGQYRAMTWTVPEAIFGMVSRRNDDILFGMLGGVSRYENYKDDGDDGFVGRTNNDTFITIKYACPWLNYGQEGHTRLKLFKSAYMYIYGNGNIAGTLRWGRDFRPLEYSLAFSSAYVASGSEYGSAEYAEDEYAAGLRMRRKQIAMKGQGQFLKVYLELTGDNDSKIALQEIAMRVKQGRQV